MSEGVKLMDMPSNRRLVILFGMGFLLALLEPIVLLAMGNDIAGALWPMAIRSLELTLFLREWRTFAFGFFLLSTSVVLTRCNNSGSWEKVISALILGLTTGLLVIFTLLDIAYLRGAFILLPTAYGFIILCTVLMVSGLPKNPFDQENIRLKRILHIGLVLFSVWLIGPGLSAMAGLSPSPPELGLEKGQYSVKTTVHEYPMPEEVASIQGDYEEDVTFSVYLSLPQNYDGEMPLAIILHGFANPFFSTYEDWLNELASRGMAVVFVQYPSDVEPPGHDTYDLHEEDGMSNHPFHNPRAIAIYAALEFMTTILPSQVNENHLMIGGHSLGAGYALLALDWSLERGWGNESLFINLEAPYARPVQDHLQINTTGIPEEFMAHVVISEDDMSVNDCFGVHHQALLGGNALFIEVPSDRHGYPRLVASHYVPAAETHDTLADWGFYRRVASQADWLVARNAGDDIAASIAQSKLVDSPELRNMGEWSDGQPVNELGIWDDALNSTAYEHCKTWTGPD